MVAMNLQFIRFFILANGCHESAVTRNNCLQIVDIDLQFTWYLGLANSAIKGYFL